MSMKHQAIKIELVKELRTNLSSFPELFPVGTEGEIFLEINKEKGVVMAEFKFNNKIYLLTIDDSFFKKNDWLLLLYRCIIIKAEKFNPTLAKQQDLKFAFKSIN